MLTLETAQAYLVKKFGRAGLVFNFLGTMETVDGIPVVECTFDVARHGHITESHLASVRIEDGKLYGEW